MNKTDIGEQELGQFIRNKLNSRLIQLDKPIVDRLHVARQNALARQLAMSTQFSLVSAGHHAWTWCEDNLRPFLMALSLVAAILGVNQIMSMQRMDDLEDVDSALLTDDLPINAYLDNGFHSWLATDASSQR